MGRNMKFRSIVKSKKATGLDTILAISTIFGLAVLLIVLVYVYTTFVDFAKTTPTFNETQQVIDVMEDLDTTNNMWDWFILVVFIGFAIAMFILGYMIDVNTVFMPFFILIMLVGLIIAGALNYSWNQIADTTLFTTIKSTRFPITSHLMNHLTIYYTIIAALALIGTYAKSNRYPQ